MLVREANDFAVVLTDAQGRSLAQSTMSIASFIGSLPATVKHFLDVFPAHTLKPGDVMITNDPWMGTGHIHDVNIAMPIFHKGKIVAFAAVVSHMPDIGGRLRNAGVREIYEEGLQIPRLKLIDAGKPNQTLLDMIAQNVRVPEMTLGDIWAQVAACKMLEERLQPLLRDTDLDALGAEIRRRSEAAMRKAIRAVPDGVYHSRLEHDGFEEPIVINCTVHGERRHASTIDYTGSSDQVPRAVNVVPIYCFAYSAYAVKALLCPDVPNNEGSFLPITTSAPLGSIFNPRYPAASGGRGMIGHMMVPAIMMALAQALPERAIAEGSSNSSITVAGRARRPAVLVDLLHERGPGRDAASRRLLGAVVSVEPRQHADRSVRAAGAAARDRAQHPARQRRRRRGIAAAAGCTSRSKRRPTRRCSRR